MSEKSRYIAAAADYGRFSISGDHIRGNSAYREMKAALAELRKSADRGETILSEVLDHPNGWVRMMAATHLLPMRPELASSTLKNLASDPERDLRIEAELVLREWQMGRLKVP